MAATPKIAQLQKSLDQARQKAGAHVSTITKNDANLNADGIAAELEKARRADTAEIEAIRRELAAAKDDERRNLLEACFGVPADGAAATSYRLAIAEARGDHLTTTDARAANLKTCGDRAILIGDTEGARAVALVAYGERAVPILSELAKHSRDLADLLAFEYQYGVFVDVANAAALSIRESLGSVTENVTDAGAMVATPFS